MSTNQTRIRQTQRLLKWIKRYPGYWYQICTPGGGHMDIGRMGKMVKRLADEELYELIFVLLMVHREDGFMAHISDFVLLDILSTHWNREHEEIMKLYRDILV